MVDELGVDGGSVFVFLYAFLIPVLDRVPTFEAPSQPAASLVSLSTFFCAHFTEPNIRQKTTLLHSTTNKR